MKTELPQNIADRGEFLPTVNGEEVKFFEPVNSARKILETAKFIPPDDCVLIRQLPHGTVAVGLDEDVNLRAPDGNVFWAFKTDRIYRFIVEGREFDWGVAKIKDPLLRKIAHVKDDEVLYLERKDQPDLVLGPDDELDLSKPGTEHLRYEKRLIEVFFKDKPYEIARGVYTTEELMAKFPIEPGYLLNLLKPDGELVTLKPGEKIRVKCGMKFYSQVPGGGSS